LQSDAEKSRVLVKDRASRMAVAVIRLYTEVIILYAYLVTITKKRTRGKEDQSRSSVNDAGRILKNGSRVTVSDGLVAQNWLEG